MTMDEKARASWAKQMLENPLFDEIMGSIEADAIERMVIAADDTKRHEGALRVQAARSFRSDCERMLRSTRERKAAPA